MHSRRTVFATLSILVLGGCYSFQPRPDTNQALPEFWTSRDYVSAGPINNEIDYFAGRAVYRGGDGKYRFSPVRVFSKETQLKVNTVLTAFSFHSAINNEYTGNGQLPVLQLDLSGKYAYDFEIADIANVIVPDASVPTRDMVKAALPAEVATTTPIWWVSAVGLSTVRIKQGLTMGSSGTITGTGFSAGGNVVNATEQAMYIPLVSVMAVPMNPAADAVVAARPAAPEPSAVEPAVTGPLGQFATTMKSLGGPGAPAAKPIKWRAVLEHDDQGLVKWASSEDGK